MGVQVNRQFLGADRAAEEAYAQRHHGRGGYSVGADQAAEAAYAQRHHGRNGVSVGADQAAEEAYAQRHHGRGGYSVGADRAAEEAYAQRHHGRGNIRVGALIADYHEIREELGDDDLAYATAATRQIVGLARDTKTTPSAPARIVVGEDLDAIVRAYSVDEILGDDTLDDESFPITASLYRHFHDRGDPKFVRLDTEESYRDFRADQSPDIAELREKVNVLESLLHAHLHDDHGKDIVIGLASDVSKLQAREAGKQVPLQMPPWAEGTWDCWREEGPEGGLVCCSISLPGHDGLVRICTSATPVKKRVMDVVGYANDVGGDVTTLLGILPTLACMLAGRDLMVEMAAATPAILAHPAAMENSPLIGAVVPAPHPASHPTRAALLALLRMAQTGDARATTEWKSLAGVAARNHDLAESMSAAREKLLWAQSEGIL